jgi:hypothetical protein
MRNLKDISILISGAAMGLGYTVAIELAFK